MPYVINMVLEIYQRQKKFQQKKRSLKNENEKESDDRVSSLSGTLCPAQRMQQYSEGRCADAAANLVLIELGGHLLQLIDAAAQLPNPAR